MIKVIKEKDIKNLPLLATGFKIFNEDWSSNCGKYNYAGKNKTPINKIFEEQDDIVICRSGMHFCKRAIDCLNYYELLPNSKFAKVEAYGELVNSDDNDKTSCKIMKVVRVYEYNEFIDIIEQDLKQENFQRRSAVNSKGGRDLEACDFCTGDDIHSSTGIVQGFAVDNSSNVKNSKHIKESNAIRNCEWTWESSYISNSVEVDNCVNVENSKYIAHSSNVSNSKEIKNSDDVKGCIKVEMSDTVSSCINCRGIFMSYGLNNCRNMSESLFCFDLSNKELYLFNKKSTASRISEIRHKIINYGWTTNFGTKVHISIYEAWKIMPKGIEDYIRSLPEFDEEVWNKITERRREV